MAEPVECRRCGADVEESDAIAVYVQTPAHPEKRPAWLCKPCAEKAGFHAG